MVYREAAAVFTAGINLYLILGQLWGLPSYRPASFKKLQSQLHLVMPQHHGTLDKEYGINTGAGEFRHADERGMDNVLMGGEPTSAHFESFLNEAD